MATANHGRHAMAYADLTSTATGTLSAVPMIVDYQISGSTDDTEITSTDSTNKEFLTGFKNVEITINSNIDADSDAIYQLSDGAARAMLFYFNRQSVAGKRRYIYGPFSFSLDESGGVSAALKNSIKAKAAGSITRGFA